MKDRKALHFMIRFSLNSVFYKKLSISNCFQQPVSRSLNDRLKSVARNKWRETSVTRTGIIIRSNARLLWRCAICTTHYGLQFPQSNKFLCTAPKVNSSYFPLNCKKSLEFQMSFCFFSSLRDVLLSLFSTYDSNICSYNAYLL